MREIRHENLVPFLGACVDTGNVFILSPYCSRGNLHDVLGNEDYRIDNMFTASLVADLIKVGSPLRCPFVNNFCSTGFLVNYQRQRVI